ncbi:glycoside hydrolase family 2 protein [Paenibacillus puerhi]|uniref:glycoside hydrolase family 2 protein n=1 Tax=Paenibacillus puerhi TaxID=2692622 RepID=UPI0013590F51|nr:sugar-binding domain-containing protein [Paenibacillus puerhi]
MDVRRKVISLDGDWEFAYRKEAPDMQQLEFPQRDDYEVKMPVPGYWDDYTDRLRYTNFWSRDCKFNPDYRNISAFPMGAGKPPDTSLPFLLGAGWYKKSFTADAEWKERSVTLHVGGVTLEAWVWLNGQFIGYHLGHLTPFELSMDEALRFGERNELVIVVANTRTDRIGCSIRGFQGKSAGITRSVYLQVTGETRIRDCYVRPNAVRDQLIWEMDIAHKSAAAQLTIDWEIVDPLIGQKIAKGSQNVSYPLSRWTTEVFGLEAWSDRNPRLYQLRFILRDGIRILDTHEQPFGFRNMEALGRKLLLNGEPVLLRGLTDHAYFPETCTVPTARSFYMDTLQKLKRIGFNWIRFHTWTPPEECLIAADELGMMLQVEAPNGFQETDWLDILTTCRKHPSVVIYCCGNEVALDEQMLDHLELMAQHCKRLAPDALFNPMEGLRAVEYELDESDPGFVEEPYPHNAAKLKRLDTFSDVYAPHGSIFSYHSLATDDALMERRLAMLQRPSLMHEVGINDSYLNLDLEHRYVGTRIGPELFTAARAYLKEMGVLKHAPVYYQNSCRWMHQIVKFSLEQARRYENVSGYDLLGAIDCHWHRTGYAVGLLNEFYELKAGISEEAVMRYNGESVLLANCGTSRNLKSGEVLSVRMFASLYGSDNLELGMLKWQLVDDQRRVYARGEKEIPFICNGKVTDLGMVEVETPDLLIAKHLILEASLSGGAYEIRNQWDYWVFPSIDQLSQPSALTHGIKIVNEIDSETLNFIADGGRALLLGKGPFPTLKTTFQIMSGGRVQGNNATVIHDHPILSAFPHEGFCDWQFYSMMEGAQTVVFNELNFPFVPIVEIVSSYKMIRKQASLFELGIGSGGLIVCTLNLDTTNPGASYLQHRMLSYLISDAFSPKVKVKLDQISDLLNSSQELKVDFSTDEGYDNGGHVDTL